MAKPKKPKIDGKIPPKEEPSPEAVADAKDRLRRSMGVDEEAPAADRDPLDIPIDESADPLESGRMEEVVRKIGPHTWVKIKPILEKSKSGLQKFVRHRALERPEDFKGFAEGIVDMSSAAVDAIWLVLYKYLGDVEYLEEFLAAGTIGAAYMGKVYLEKKLDADGTHRGGGGSGERKDDAPPGDPPKP